MELKEDCQFSTTTSRKRKPEAEAGAEVREETNNTSVLSSNLSMDNLNQDVLERVLSWLPTSSFFRLTSVSKRWKSAADSASFKLACAAVPSRDPWFLMLPDPRLNRPSLVFDSAENNWKTLNNLDNHRNSMPVAASGGLVCFRDALGNFAISNPLTGSVTQVPPLDPALRSLPLHAIVMTKTSNKLALVLGEEPNLSFKLYDPKANLWEKETFLLSIFLICHS